MTEEKTVSTKKPVLSSHTSALLQVIALIAVLSVLAVWSMHRTFVLLNDTLKRSVARQAADMSVIAQERFDRELSELTLAANHLAMGANAEDIDHMLASLRGKSGGMTVGLLSIHGDAIRGAALSRWLYWSLPRAYRGQNVVDYYPGRGLLFAVPVIRNGNVQGILYRLYDTKGLADRFTLTDYNPAVRLLILDRVGNLIIPYKNYGENDEAFFSDDAIRQAFGQIRDQLDTRRSAASYIERNGERYFLFASDLPKANCRVAGYIPWSAVAGDISRVHERLLRSIGVLLLIFFAVGRYIFSVQRKAAQSESLRREKAAANLANRAKSEFLANMSHEIRTPINAVLGMNEMILREGKDPAIDRYARNIRSAGRSLLDIVNDVLDFSKIESGKIEIVNGEYSLSELIRTAANMARPRTESNGLTLNLEIEPTIPDRLFGDSLRVQQIIVNLLTNAAKYTEQGGVDLIVSHDRDTEKKITLRITVRDTGIGIREEDKPKLFQGFERLDAERNRGVEGTGLGLAITKQLAVLMGGDVTFESTYGKGTTFFVTLPQEAVGTETIADAAAHSHESETHREEYRSSFIAPDAEVLVADDNELNLFVVEGLLKSTQIKIDAVTSGTAALERLAAKRYDVVLLDHRMPGPDGVETLHRAKELPNAQGVPDPDGGRLLRRAGAIPLGRLRRLPVEAGGRRSAGADPGEIFAAGEVVSHAEGRREAGEYTGTAGSAGTAKTGKTDGVRKAAGERRAAAGRIHRSALLRRERLPLQENVLHVREPLPGKAQALRGRLRPRGLAYLHHLRPRTESLLPVGRQPTPLGGGEGNGKPREARPVRESRRSDKGGSTRLSQEPPRRAHGNVRRTGKAGASKHGAIKNRICTISSNREIIKISRFLFGKILR